MKIVIISITQYKEKDAIIDAISEEGEVTFLLKIIFLEGIPWINVSFTETHVPAG